jgi:hypothetical protein
MVNDNGEWRMVCGDGGEDGGEGGGIMTMMGRKRRKGGKRMN